MNNNGDLNLKVSSNPHIRNHEDTRDLMLDVVIALLPAIAFGAYHFGVQTLIGVTVSVVSAVFFEWFYRLLLRKPQMIGDLSAVVTGLLLSMVCPPALPWWMYIVGSFFAIVIVKQLYGGLGKNFLNPALAGRAALVACYAAAMAAWNKADAATGTTPMELLKSGDMEQLVSTYELKDMFIGFVSGNMGEVSSLCLLVGGMYLIVRKVVSWHIPVAYIGTVALLTYLFPQGNDPVMFMCYHVLGGGLILGAFFMTTDYVTSPVTKEGKLIFGVGCGFVTVFIRYYGAYPDGVYYAILVMNCFTWIIDKSIKPTRFGAGKGKKNARKGMTTS